MKKGSLYKTQFKSTCYKQANDFWFEPLEVEANSFILCLSEEIQTINVRSHPYSRDLYKIKGRLFLYEKEKIIVPLKVKEHEKALLVLYE